MMVRANFTWIVTGERACWSRPGSASATYSSASRAAPNARASRPKDGQRASVHAPGPERSAGRTPSRGRIRCAGSSLVLLQETARASSPVPSRRPAAWGRSATRRAANASWALATATWSGRTMTPMLPRIDRRCTSPRRPPRAPGEALDQGGDLARGSPPAGGSPGAGRDTQSMAFLRTAVTELLYSGEAISRPSCSRKSCLSLAPSSGIPCPASRSWSKSGSGKSLQVDHGDLGPGIPGRPGGDAHELLVVRIAPRRSRHREDAGRGRWLGHGKDLSFQIPDDRFQIPDSKERTPNARWPMSPACPGGRSSLGVEVGLDEPEVEQLDHCRAERLCKIVTGRVHRGSLLGELWFPAAAGRPGRGQLV